MSEIQHKKIFKKMLQRYASGGHLVPLEICVKDISEVLGILEISPGELENLSLERLNNLMEITIEWKKMRGTRFNDGTENSPLASLNESSGGFQKDPSLNQNKFKKLELLPGDMTKRLIRLLYGLRFQQEVIDPILADLYHEIITAVREEQPSWVIKFIKFRGRMCLFSAIFSKSLSGILDFINKIKKTAK